MKKYETIYNFYKQKILQEQMKPNDRLPSIRETAASFGVSVTTVATAYNTLAADGYILAYPQSGYYVSYKKAPPALQQTAKKPQKDIRFDFQSGSADPNSFDLSLWRRYIKNALKDDVHLLSYGETQGEYELRAALSDYIMKRRALPAPPQRIVIGAGVNNLLLVLCALLDKNQTVSVPENKSFLVGENIFRQFGFPVTYRNKNAGIIYVSPSHMTRFGDVMPLKRRRELAAYTAKTGALIIEDDYESDFMYNNRPLPPIYAISGNDNVVYMGSFSKLLLPGIRIGFMVLNEKLSQLYTENEKYFVQFASKTEQTALCSYIRDGHLERQIRRIRRIYLNKTKLLQERLKNALPQGQYQISENGLQLVVQLPTVKTKEEIWTAMQNHSFACEIIAADGQKAVLLLNASAVNTEQFDRAAQTLQAIFA